MHYCKLTETIFAMKDEKKSEYQDVYLKIGQGLKKIREESAKMGVEEFADHIGVHRNTLTNIEGGKNKNFKIDVLLKIVPFSGMPLSKFFKSLGL